ncbi:MAG: family 78 glycoside hydrolase catalytic domain, partial [Clostridia bacterium]|nr:family 78 glycoside hydrolase catalytic domain [Clostridia bacterium]
MTQEHFFGKAKWVGAADRLTTTFSILRGYFTVCNASSVTLNVLGLGFFKCYINGKCINPDTFLPLSSDYENSRDPRDEIISGHRIYVPEFDITPFVKQGKNVIDVHFGGGWYTFGGRPFGLPKAIYQISVFEDGGVTHFCSDESCMISESYVSDYNFVNHETHNYAGESEGNVWTSATAVESLSTEYCRTDCPRDALIRTITPTRLGEGESGIVYDCGENTTGYPVLDIPKGATGEICVLFSEDILPNGRLDMSHHHKQKFTVLNDGSARTVQPEFTWFAFRYFEVIGNADIPKVKVVHANVSVSSSFESDSETLNWIYNTFIHTMLCNMHTGHPSDCPHLERRGYTGDGQLTCHAVLSVFDARAFYEKWLQDIADCQDILSGHIQYTAPYVHSGGGPGGWGSAIVEVPYQLYRHYGDKQILSIYYQNMRRYIDYLEAHSEFSLVTSDKEGDWCLGDWCGPNILYPDKDITFSTQQ